MATATPMIISMAPKAISELSVGPCLTVLAQALPGMSTVVPKHCQNVNEILMKTLPQSCMNMTMLGGLSLALQPH